MFDRFKIWLRDRFDVSRSASGITWYATPDDRLTFCRDPREGRLRWGATWRPGALSGGPQYVLSASRGAPMIGASLTINDDFEDAIVAWLGLGFCTLGFVADGPIGPRLARALWRKGDDAHADAGREIYWEYSDGTLRWRYWMSNAVYRSTEGGWRTGTIAFRGVSHAR
jgi:hypothetical protein